MAGNKFRVFYIKGDVTYIEKNEKKPLKENQVLSGKTVIEVPQKCGLILTDEKGNRVCLVKKAYKGKISDFVKDDDNGSSIISCVKNFFSYLGKRCYGDLQNDEKYMARKATTVRGEVEDNLTEEESFIDDINNFVTRIELETSF